MGCKEFEFQGLNKNTDIDGSYIAASTASSLSPLVGLSMTVPQTSLQYQIPSRTYMEMYTKAIEKERAEEAANGTSDIITRNPDVRGEVGCDKGNRYC